MRRKVSGDSERRRLCVFRSLKQIYCQVIDDVGHRSIAACSTLTPRLRDEVSGKSRVEAARVVLGNCLHVMGISAPEKM